MNFLEGMKITVGINYMAGGERTYSVFAMKGASRLRQQRCRREVHGIKSDRNQVSPSLVYLNGIASIQLSGDWSLSHAILRTNNLRNRSIIDEYISKMFIGYRRISRCSVVCV